MSKPIWRHCAVPKQAVKLIADRRHGERANERKEISRMARRRYQKGCVFKKGKVWVLRYREKVLSADHQLRTANRALTLGGFSSAREARRAAEAHLRKVNNGTGSTRVYMTLKQFWESHFQTDILPMLKPNTVRLYKLMFTKHIEPSLGQLMLRDLGRHHIQRLIAAKQQENYSTQTLRHIRSTLGKMFGVALQWGWVEANPARGVMLPPMQRVRTPNLLSPEQIKTLVGALSEQASTIVLLGATTGLRIGELLGLQVGDVDFDSATLHVRRTVSRGEVGSPKTQGSARRIPLPQEVLAYLRNFLGLRQSASSWLFSNSSGTPWDDRNLFNRSVKPVCDRLGLRFSWHSLRHTFSTLQGNQGAPLPVLQSLLGHTTARVTMAYTHPLEDVKREAMERVSSLLFPIVPLMFPTGNGEDRSDKATRLN
ncbi:MAG: site-specific integrase [Acidobacteria bacterium]|nr:MAG: site-specific integrase [Acidobacteriota bacterium]